MGKSNNKRWIRRNRHKNKDLVEAVKQHQRWPSFKIVRRHPITKQYLVIDLRQLQVKSYIEFLRQCDREYIFLELLEQDIINNPEQLQCLSQDLIDKVKNLFKDVEIDVDAEIKDDED
jgi:hypothetical protein